MSFKLSKRLSFIRHYSPIRPHILDIGCDHGDLGLSFVDEPDVETLNFIDSSQEVTERLKTKTREADIPKVNLIAHIKVQALKIKKDKYTILMCGFGGHQMIEGVENLARQVETDSVFVLSPHRDYLKLREYLSQHSFNLLFDLVVEDKKVFYPLIIVSPGEGEKVHPYGDNLWQSEEGRGFRAYLLSRLENHQNPQDQAFFRYLGRI